VSARDHAAAVSAASAWLARPPAAGVSNNYAKAVRLAFHDCHDSGCDGCVDVARAENRGLGPAVSELNALYAAGAWKGSGMSRADWYALVATRALDVAGRRGDKAALGARPALPYRYGRATCAGSNPANATYVRALPSALAGSAAGRPRRRSRAPTGSG
jgi:hypothetical protein